MTQVISKASQKSHVFTCLQKSMRITPAFCNKLFNRQGISTKNSQASFYSASKKVKNLVHLDQEAELIWERQPLKYPWTKQYKTSKVITGTLNNS